ncbi:helix-turn-helix domain-containing protein [Fusibacter paucivorans]|uniref:Helix-turn-helix domain-containing protein n=1 Tax=Fusibacter paucivorans TaxID=76009 RepID=A0ABS5PS15_9FIRM|nr:helix-turn-helix domain-containing protein [Fusibacter paucivorans]MBS7527955.1 helix-turn-helix domain-containing protein [Fusibacter paucivorans]
MEFNEKLQQLRKEKNLTQEALAQRLFVSRATISKWESGRGYPSIDSLKAISQLFDISIDDLLSNEELIRFAEEDKKENMISLRYLLYGILDVMSVIFVFIPLFGQKKGDIIQSVSLLKLEWTEPYMRIAYFTVIGIGVLYGAIELALQKYQNELWKRYSAILSLGITITATVLFIISRQPYMAFFMFWIVILKGVFYLKHQ